MEKWMREAIGKASEKIDHFVGCVRGDGAHPGPATENIITIELNSHRPKNKTLPEILIRAARKMLSKCDETEGRGYNCDCWCHTGDWPYESTPHCTCLCGEADSLRLAFKAYDEVNLHSDSKGI